MGHDIDRETWHLMWDDRKVLHKTEGCKRPTDEGARGVEEAGRVNEEKL